MNKRKYLVGIDPSFATMGASIYNPETKKIIEMFTGDFNEVVGWIGRMVKLSEVYAIVENPALDKAVFKMWGLMLKEVHAFARGQMWKVGRIKVQGHQANASEVQSQFAICMNYAQKVGENKAAAKLIIKMLAERGVPVIEVAPSERERAFKKDKKGKIIRKDVRLLKMPTKTSQEQFKTLTGWEKRSSEHARDSATLLWGKNLTWCRNMAAIELAKAKGKPSSYPSKANYNEFVIDKNSVSL